MGGKRKKAANQQTSKKDHAFGKGYDITADHKVVDDEEISEDGAFNSEDEREFGHFFSRRKDADFDEDELAGDENEPTMLDMMDESESNDKDNDDDDDDDASSVSSKSSSSSADLAEGNRKFRDMMGELSSDKKTRAKKAIAESNMLENVSKQKLSLSTMMSTLPPKYGQLKKRLEKLEQAKTITEPAARVVQERAERKVGYEKASEEVGKWLPTVIKNRDAKSLSFPLNETKQQTNTATLAESFEPKTQLEEEINQALVASGLDDETKIKDAEEKHMLEVNQLDPEQIEARRKELSKLRALMFYEEQKAKRSNKIKSKMYRRLKKRRLAREDEKDRQQLAQVDPEASRLLDEKAILARTEERMSLRHKNTSKFIRGLLKHGGNKKDYVREIVTKQHELANKLKQRIRSMNNDSDDSDDELDEPLDEARGMLAQIEKDKAAAAPKGLMGMKFMQRGLEKQKEKVKARADLLVKALEEGRLPQELEELEEGNDTTIVSGRRKFLPKAGEHEDDGDQKEDGTGVEDKKKRAKGVEARTSGFVTVKSSSSASSTARQIFETPAFEIAPEEEQKQEQEQEKSDKEEEAGSSNPWLSNRRLSKKKKRKQAPPGEDEVKVDVAKSTIHHAKPKESEEDSLKRRRIEQAKLIKRAFAGINVLQRDFEKEKEEQEKLEAERKADREAKMHDKPGWGSWTGAGIVEKKKKPVVVKPVQNKRKQTKQHVIISNKRNKASSNYQVQGIPYPFTSKAQYEQSLQNPLGSDWNTVNTFKKLVKPDVVVKPGSIIEPLQKDQKKSGEAE